MLLPVSPVQPEEDKIRLAAEVIRRGGLVAFPTETVYGLGADALNPEAVARIFAAKKRPLYDPIIVHIAGVGDLPRVTRQVTPQARQLAEAFWPGPLTLILPQAEAVPTSVTAGRDTVAVRCPDHAVALALIRVAGTPIAAPSANLFGHTSPTTAQHVLDDLGEQVELILDAGPTPIGVESTVLDLTQPVPTILRPGGLPREALEAVLGEVALLGRIEPADEGLPSPGLLPRHYAPRAQLLLFVGSAEALLTAMGEWARTLTRAGRRVGVLIADEDRALLPEPVIVQRVGLADDLDSVARNLFAALRALDGQGVEVILARDFGTAGLGLAVRDRLSRAAGGQVIEAQMDLDK